ncbi:MAG: PKD domain-containing protein, partial [Flavobacteriales bacterium]
VVCAGSEVYFSDKSNGDPTSWEWSFSGGDTTASSKENPGPIQYDSIGNFNVTLIVTNGSDTDTTSIDSFINVIESPDVSSDVKHISCNNVEDGE